MIAPVVTLNASPPTPTPSPTATATALPTATPTPLPPPTLPPSANDPAGDRATIRPATDSKLSLSAGLALCESGGWGYFPWILLAILAVLLLIWAWRAGQNINRKEGKRVKRWPRACFLARLLLVAYLLFLIWLFVLPWILNACPKSDSVFFWRRDASTDLTGVFVSQIDSDDVMSFGEINKNGCVGCHNVSANNNRIAAIGGGAPGQLLIYDLDGERVRLPQPVTATYVALSPDGQRAAIATPDGDIAIVDLRSGTVTPLSGANDPSIVETMPSWGPNGRIAFVVVTDPSQAVSGGLAISAPTDIYTIPEIGGVAEPLAGASGEGFDYYPAYSPDGNWLAFTHHENANTYSDEEAEIWLVPANGGPAGPIAANYDDFGAVIPGAANSWPSWSRDSKFLAFNSKRRDLSFDIYYTTINETGGTGIAKPLKGASEIGVFEHIPAWGPPPKLADPLAQMLSLWPWLLPLLPLFLLAWLLCRTKTTTVVQPLGGGRVVEPPVTPLPIEVKELDVLWEPRPALIVGLGETGRRVLTHLKKNLLDANNGQMPDKIRLLCVDTGDYEQLKHRDQTAAVTFAGVELSPGETLAIKGTLRPLMDRDLNDHPEYDAWLQQSAFKQLGEQALTLNMGAGQRRPFARAGFLQQLQEQDDNLLARVRRLAPECLESDDADPDTGTKTLRIIIVGDTHGDAGSALLLDLAIIAHRVGQELSVTGTTTSAHLLAHRESVTEQVNTAATLREIMRFQLAEARPFDVKMGVKDLDGKCDWLPLDSVQIYDSGNQHGFEAQRRFHPVIADAITASLDKATYQHDLRNMARDEDAELRRVQRDTYRVHVATENVYQYRLPFIDLINSLRSTFMSEVVRRLINGNNPNKVSVDETYVRADETADDLATYFLSGRWGLKTTPQAALLAMSMLLEGADDQNDLINALRDASRSNPEKPLRQRLVDAISTILNGQAKTKPLSGRAGKLRLALNFLTALPKIIEAVQKRLAEYTSGDEGRGAENLSKALDKLNDLVAQLLVQLQPQADALGVDNPDEDSLYGRVTRLQTNLIQQRAEMDEVTSRTYIWDVKATEDVRDSERVPLETHWYTEYLFPRLDEALRQFYWEVDENGAVLTLTVDKVITLDPDRVFEAQAGLYRLATTYCDPIRTKETLAKLLRTGALSEDQVISTAQTLLDKSQVPLPYASELAMNQRWDVLLVANVNVAEADQLANYIRPQLTDQEFLKRLKTSDPFVLGIKQRRSVLPLHVTNVYRQTLDTYRQENGLMVGPGAKRVQQRPFTAIYETEQIALDLESRMAEEINVTPNPLHPIVVIGLTAPKRAYAYCLALASGEIGIEGPLPGSNRVYEITLYADELPDGEKVFPIPETNWQSPLHPLLQGYLWFVNDQHEFSMDMIDEMLERYRTDTSLPAIWQDWLYPPSKPGDGNGWHEYTLNLDEFNHDAMTDLINMTRLWVLDFRRRRS